MTTLDYQTFLTEKRAVLAASGRAVTLDEINPLLFSFQADLVRWSVRKGRAALFADTGLGKTFMQLEWARLIGVKRVLIVARDADDERHICPLQLGTIERCVRLWSNPGETVLSPFAGIGSEGHTALTLGRHFIGIELKPAYFTVAARNLRTVLQARAQLSMFDLAEQGAGVAA